MGLRDNSYGIYTAVVNSVDTETGDALVTVAGVGNGYPLPVSNLGLDTDDSGAYLMPSVGEEVLIAADDGFCDLFWVTKYAAGSSGSYLSINGGTLTGDLDLDGIAPGASSLRVTVGEGYAVYADNEGPGPDDSRLWVDGPDGGAIYIGPRAGGNKFDTAVVRSEELRVEGVVTELQGASQRQVVESGSNANGRWTRFSSGLQVCEFQGSRTVSINGAYGSLWIGQQAFTFPAVFSSTPAVSPGEAQYAAGASWASAYDATTSGCSIRYYDIVSRASASMPVSYIAVGRWY